MNHHHRKVLHSLFAHPISANIDLKDVVAVMTELGAAVDNRTGARIGITQNDRTAVFHHAQHSLPKDEVVQIRKFLIDCGVAPEQFPV